MGIERHPHRDIPVGAARLGRFRRPGRVGVVQVPLFRRPIARTPSHEVGALATDPHLRAAVRGCQPMPRSYRTTADTELNAALNVLHVTFEA